jgi:hypothetical protein
MTEEALRTRTEKEMESGIEVLSVRLSAGGYMLELQYRVVDAELARPLFWGHVRPYVVDQASGTRLSGAGSPDVGPVRAWPEPNRVYFMFFGNATRIVEAGSRVTVVVGDIRLDLQVEPDV